MTNHPKSPKSKPEKFNMLTPEQIGEIEARQAKWPRAEWIAHARNDIPALLAHVRELEGENERLTKKWTEYERWILQVPPWMEAHGKEYECGAGKNIVQVALEFADSRIAELEAENEQLNDKLIKKVLELAALQVKPIVDEEKKGEIWP